MKQCFYCHKKPIIKHEICPECATNPFITEKYRKYLANSKKRQLFLDTFHNNCFENLPNMNAARSWDFLIKYHRYYEDSNKITQLRVRKIIELVPPDRAINIFDLGFGYGHVLLELETKGYRRLGGVDISKEAVNYISGRIHNGNFQIGSFTQIPLDDDSVDLVIASEVMEHVPPKDTFIVYDEIKRITKQQGLVIFSVPLNDNLETTTFMCPHGQLVNPNGHVREYTPDVLDLELGIAGLTPIRRCLLIPPIQGRLKLLRIVMRIISSRQPSNYICIARKSD